MKVVLAATALSLLFATRAGAAPAETVGQFCAVWERVCNRVCPGARPGADCPGECSRMKAGCNRTGCFPFTNPRPRCFNNATDRALTDPKNAPGAKR
jgi:hypothetical protein